MPHSFIRTLRIAVAGTLAAFALVGTSAAAQSEPTVVFPFELLDSTQEGELFPRVKPEETKRLVLLTEELRTRLAATGRFALVSTDIIAADVKQAAPLHRCNGCETDLAKKVGAKLAVLGVVQKFSDTLLAVNLQIVETESGKVRGAYNAGIQGNTDEAWLRGVSYIVRNKISEEVQK